MKTIDLIFAYFLKKGKTVTLFFSFLLYLSFIPHDLYSNNRRKP